MSAPGLVSLVSAGPGDPELITLRGLRALQEADAVLYDRLSAPELLAHCRRDAELVDVGKRPDGPGQDDITALLVKLALDGKRIVRLKGGDAFTFGRGAEEIDALAAEGIPFEVVPGVTAASGAGACCGMPLTVRGVSASLTLVTGHEDPTKDRVDVDWGALAKIHGTIVIYMGMSRLGEIAPALIEGGLSVDTPVAVVRRATTCEQILLHSTLGEVAEAVRRAGLSAPALIIIGEVTREERRRPWFEARPLFGRSIVVTRSRAQASSLVAGLRGLGALVHELPTIEIVPPDDLSPVNDALKCIDGYDMILFTSANAVDSVSGRLAALGLDSRCFKGLRIGAIGDATAAALGGMGLRADFVPGKGTSEGLLESLSTGEVSSKRILLPQAQDARQVLADGLRSMGAQVDVVVAYVSRPPESQALAGELAAGALVDGTVDMVTFTSSSTVTNLADLLGARGLGAASGVPAGAIGPVTAATARELGFTVVAEPEKPTVAALVESIEEHFLQTSERRGE